MGEILRLPVVAQGAEFLVQGFLMRRNILTYKAPPNNEGYDLISHSPGPPASHEANQGSSEKPQRHGQRRQCDCEPKDV